MKKLKRIFLLALLLFAVYLFFTKPRKISCHYTQNFSQLNTALKKFQPGANAAIVDLNALDHNAAFVVQKLGTDFKIRLTAKSLPSLELIQYLMQQCHTNRLMVFSEPFITALLTRFNGDSLDLLLGKPLPADALARLDTLHGFRNINWLVDTKERLNDYLAFAKQKNMPLRISVEIDVGLHRGGFETTKEFAEAIQTIKNNPQYLQLTGLMGYDGHVPYVPFYFNKERAIRRAFVNVQNEYTAFVNELKKHYDEKFVSQLVFNGGGSKTYFYYPEYKNSTTVNEIAMGSGFLAPEEFSELQKLGHQPALFMASPVLKKLNNAQLPHAEKLSGIVNWWNPNIRTSYFMLGGGWAGEEVQPEGMIKNPFWNDDRNVVNLLPNQALLCSSGDNDIHVGDFVFYRPWEGDGMLEFKHLLLLRGNQFVGDWETYDGGN